MKYRISAVESGGSKIAISFQSGLTIEVSPENYLRFDYLYAGKELTVVQYKDLLNYEKDEDHRRYLRQLAKSGVYSKYQCRQRLMQRRGLDEKTAERLTDNLEKEGIIDDRNFVEIKLDILQAKNCAPALIEDYFRYEARIDEALIREYAASIAAIDEDRIRREVGRVLEKASQRPLKKRQEAALIYLLQKRFSFDYSQQVIADYCRDNELDAEVDDRYKAALMQKLDRKYQRYGGLKKRELICGALLQEGFDLAEAQKMTALFGNEETAIAAVAERLYRSVMTSATDSSKKESLFYKKMANLGYTLGAIKNVIEENEYEF